MINGETPRPANVYDWHGMPLIINESVPTDAYIITDSAGDILSGGNIVTGKTWLCKTGNPARVYAPENVAREMMGTIENIKRLH